jgi:uncharacterized membrane protein YbhN (UPF0104 family)
MSPRSWPRVAASIALAVVAVSLVGMVPAAAGTTWTGVASTLQGVSFIDVALLAALWLGGLAANSTALAAALPGLTNRRALTLSLTGSAVANVLPLGGAAGIGLNYAMTRRWGFSRSSFAAYTTLTNVLDVATKLLVAAVAGATLLILGKSGLLGTEPAGLGLGALIAIPVLMGALLRARVAARVGHALDRLVAVGALVTRRPWRSSFHRTLPSLSRTTVALFRERWTALAAGSGGYVVAQLLLLGCCLHTVGVDLPAIYVLAGFAADRLLTLLPVTPGGVGVVEAGLTAALTTLNGPADGIAAGVLLYRGFTYLAEIPVGGAITAVWLLLQTGAGPRRRSGTAEVGELAP